MELQKIRSKDSLLSEKIPDEKPIEHPPSFFSKYLFFFIYPVLDKATHSTLEISDTFPLPDSELIKHETLTPMLKKHKILYSLIKCNWKLLLLSIVLGNLTVLLEFSGPIYMELLILYIEKNEHSTQYSLFLSISFTILCILYPIISNNRYFYNQILTLRARNSIFNTIYNKTLFSLNLPEGVGVNLLQVDTSKITRCFDNSSYLFNIPIQLSLAIYIIHSQVGTATWVGIATMVSAMLVNFFFASTCKKLSEQVMKIRDERMEKSTELLTEIKMIKAYNWESSFLNRIQSIRKAEMSKLRILNVLHSLNIFYFWTLPSLTTVAILIYYTLVLDLELSSSKTFVTLTTLTLLQEPLRAIPNLFSSIIQMVVSAKRIQELIDTPEWKTLEDSGKIQLENCSFAYKDKEVLKNITLEVNTGEFIAVIGPIGSGKSSLLLGLLGEVVNTSGSLLVDTDIAYAPSLDSWLLNASIRDNILMGKPFQENWYWQVVEACCLLPDFKVLPGADSTEVGERGINLSGGQKARICLARAVYSDKHVILLDDPLSSVDNNVAAHIFNKCFKQLLKNKTRVLVTHRHNFLPNVDRVVEIVDGKIYKITTGSSVKEDQKEEAGHIEETVKSRQEEKLVEEEERETGEVNKEVYLDYHRFGGGYIWITLALISMSLWLGTRMAGDILLKDWSNRPQESDFYLPIYIILKIGGCSFILIRSIILTAVLSIKTSIYAHEMLMKSFLRAPINLFYDITPLGRILNRLSKDINTIDETIAFAIGTLIAQSLQCISCVLMTLIYIPYMIIIVPFIYFPSKYIGYLYKRASRDLTRLESMSRSPILSNYKQSLSGVKFIRSFNQTTNFISKNHDLINLNTKLNYSLAALGSWMGLYLGLLSAVILSVLFCCGVYFGDRLSVGVIGLCLTYMIPLPEEMSDLIGSITAIENQMVSVERVKAYMNIPTEQPLETSYDQKYSEWPRKADIQFSKVVMKYRPNTEVVLRGVNFKLNAGVRAGITGRTGSGKSSLFLGLLRIVELDSGVISIDGVNIALLGLKKLRTAITLVPQDPLIFNGTLRENLDPLDQFPESTVAKILEEVGLKFPLDYEIKNSGQNLSIGERQILSLCRAMICNTKILLFDETTAGVDPEMDTRIQGIIKGKFQGCTVITIAHRLATILDNDIIVMLDHGKVIEFGSPQELIVKDTEFNKLVKHLEH